MSQTVRLRVNGEAREYAGEAAPSTVMDLVSALGLDAKMVVVELNGDIISRDGYVTTPLSDGDAVELVRLVGGG